ncbi:MAG: diguanylate cyclase, partial [Phycisphaerales bacterium]|nr:diguanylate cyclase [Phycisphaerales bacterium]
DLDMPVMDGFAVLRALRANPATVNTSVVVLSELSDSQDKVAAFDLGATDYVTKPFDFSELRARVRSALRTQRLMQLLAERAEVDGLTGLANRAAFNRRWSQEVNESQWYGRPLSLAVMDIDHFKKINDTYGHPAGDEVIQGFARVITGFTRDCDIACRYGGEEFCVIMPETAPEAAKIVGERIREAMAGTRWARHPEHAVTVSVGIAGCAGTAAGLTPEVWLDRADKALYTAKHGGRNRTVVDVIDAGAPLKMAG